LDGRQSHEGGQAISVGVKTTLAVVVAGFFALASVGEATAPATRSETFVANGPAGITGGDSYAVDGTGRVTGAVQAIVTHPTDPNTVWIGSVNGGVWKTTNATSIDPAGPTWTPLTDDMPGLSIRSLELDPTDSSNKTLVAGIGSASSFNGISGKLTGILRTDDGGTTWTDLGQTELGDSSVYDALPRGSDIVVANGSGIWRSHDTGASFQQVSGLPALAATDLAGDPSDTQRLYTAFVGSGGGVYTSTDGGKTWTALGGGDFGGATGSDGDVVAGADKVQLAVSPAGNNPVYAAVQTDGLTNLLRSTDHGTTWTAMEVPDAIEGSGRSLMAMTTDPTDAHLVYITGRKEELGGEKYYRCDSTQPIGSQCTSFNLGSGHVDSRDMEFNAGGFLFESDDGGVFMAVGLPLLGIFYSVIGNLAVSETHSCAYDHVSHVALCGTQDIGTPEQPSEGASEWTEVQDDDGGAVAIADWGSPSTRYYSAWPGAAELLRFTRASCSSGNSCTRVEPALKVDGIDGKSYDLAHMTFGSGGDEGFDPGIATFPYVPIAADQVEDTAHPQRLVIATDDEEKLDGSTKGIYESFDGGENLDRVSGLEGKASAIAYGGRSNSVDNPDVLWVGSDSGLFLRQTSGSSVAKVAAYPGELVRAISLDPDDWKSAWVAGASNVYHTSDAGTTWDTFTGDIETAGADDLRSIAFIPGSANTVVVGSSDGVYVTDADATSHHWAKLTGALPNTIAYTLDYDSSDDVLLIGTMGRGTWLLPDASTINRPPKADAGGPYTTDEGQDITLDGSGSSDPDTAKGDAVDSYAWDLNDDGSFETSGATATFDRVGEDGDNTVSLRVTDQLGATDTQSTTVTVLNVPPTVTLNPVAPAAENTQTTVKGTLTDPGWKDPLFVTVDFGDGAVSVPGTYTSTPHGLARLAFTAKHTYGDNGTYTVTVCGSDDDTTVCTTVDAVVTNVDPDAHIDPAGLVIAHAGDPVHFRGTSFDPGSDDRTTKWDFGDGLLTTTISYDNGVSPDPPQSPDVHPRTVVDEKVHVYATACLYTARFSARDDDGGASPVVSEPVVIVGNGDRAKDNGYWKKQFDTGGGDFDQATLTCYLAIVNFMSSVFSEARDAHDIPSAFLVLKPDPSVDPRMQDFDRELLTAWLNFANGAVELTDTVTIDGKSVVTFAAELAQAEALRLAPATSKTELDKHKSILEKFNHL
jgi:photosystem II stability/assembly factor-like uncharacterized protein